MGRMQQSTGLVGSIIFVVLTHTGSLLAQPKGPQPWWPTQPTPLPFVHSLFTDGMVLQRDIEAPVWGWSTPGDRIAITFDGQSAGKAAVAGGDGRWITRIGPFKAGGPHTLTVTGGSQSVELLNVLCGDVWLCSGQSNMNWPVRLCDNAEDEVKAANYLQIRSFTVGFYPSLVPMKVTQPAQWEICSPGFAKNFTGVGYFFAREIHQTQKIPIGIIHSSVGATYAEAWVSRDALQQRMPYDFIDRLAEVEQAAGKVAEPYDYFDSVQNWLATLDPQSARQKYASDPPLDTTDWLDMIVPGPWEEAGLSDFDGLVWFRRAIDVPADWAGKDLLLQLSVINDIDVTWFNGTLVSCRQTGGTRNYKLDARLVKPGKNLLTVAILNREGPGGFCSAPRNMALRQVADANKVVRIHGTWNAKPATAIKDIAVPFPVPKVGHYKTITGMYNGMIAPLIPFAIKGTLWYQGESNGPRWLEYRRLLPTLIADWRMRFDVGEFSFLIVSLANNNARQTQPVEPGWAEIRESQWRTVRKVPNTGLAMTIDTSDGSNIHPRNKQEVGRRLALVARNKVYGEKDLIYSGPEFTEMQTEAPKHDRIRLYFRHLGGGLMIRPGDRKLAGFAIAGPDKEFVWGHAVIDGDTIVVSSPDIATPKHVRYRWAWNPIGNLYNKAGLPAITFRTDE